MGIVKRMVITIIIGVLCTFQALATTYVIDKYEITIKGRTRENAVRRHIAYDEGKTFESQEELEYAIERKRQALLDLRIFKGVDASWEAGAEVDGKVPVTIKIHINGALSFIVFPSISYDSNYGFFYQCYVEDQNFLGTTGKTKFSFAVRENDNKHDWGYANLNTYLETDLPLGRNWDLFNQIYLRHSGRDGNETTLTLDHRLRRRILETGHIANIVYINSFPESDLRSDHRKIEVAIDRIEFGFNDKLTYNIAEEVHFTEDAENMAYSTTYVSASLNLKNIIGHNITPTIRFDVPAANGQPGKPVLTFLLNAQDYYINWSGDFRDGYTYNIDAVLRTSGNHELAGNASLFTTPFDWMQLSTRLCFRLANYPEVPKTELFTQNVRGIRNDNVQIEGQEINSIGTINLDAQFKLFRIPKFLNAYIGPFVELGYMSTGNFIACVGAEMLLVLDEWPGAPGRLTIARNLLDPNEIEFSAFAYFFY